LVLIWGSANKRPQGTNMNDYVICTLRVYVPSNFDVFFNVLVWKSALVDPFLSGLYPIPKEIKEIRPHTTERKTLPF
jgi:hypothetical protein